MNKTVKKKRWEKRDKGGQTGNSQQTANKDRDTSKGWITNWWLSLFWPHYLQLPSPPSTFVILRFFPSPNLMFSLLYHLCLLFLCLHFFPFLYLQALFPLLLSPASFPSFLSYPFISVVLSPHSPSCIPMANSCLNNVSVESWKVELIGSGHHRAECAHNVSTVLLRLPKNKNCSQGQEAEPDVIIVRWRTNRRQLQLWFSIFFYPHTLNEHSGIAEDLHNIVTLIMVIKKHNGKQDRAEKEGMITYCVLLL